MSSGITAISGTQAADLAGYVGGRSQAQAPAPDSAPATSAAAAHLTPNPSLRIDSALALVVIEFHGPDGAIENSIPTAQQLDAYRRSQGAERPAGAVPTTAAASEQAAAQHGQTGAPPIVA